MMAMMGLIAVIHFVIEAFIMGTFSRWNLTYDVIEDGLLDSTSLTILSSPLIYYYVVKPFVTSARDSKETLGRTISAQSAQAVRLETALNELRQSLSANEDLRDRLQQSNEKIAEINELTLQRIGADLHDGPAQLLTYSLLRLDRFAPAVESTHGQNGADEHEHVRAALSDTLTELRNISRGLSLPQLSLASLGKTIELAVALHQEQTGTKVDVTITGLPDDVPQSLKVCVYRVVQESLANAYKHAHASNQKVAAYMDKQLVLEISDTGPGFDTPAPTGEGLGLTGMRARVGALGGTLTIATGNSGGTRLIARLDVDATTQWEAGYVEAL